MHSEHSRRKRASVLEIIITIGLLFTVVLLLNMLFYQMGIREVYSDLLTIFLPIALVVYILHNNRIAYQYTLICDEFIIKECYGHKEQVILDINLNQVVEIHNGPISRQERKEYALNKRFIDASKCRKRRSYYCIYIEDGVNFCFQFQPSDKLLEKVRNNSEELKQE